jgi:lipoprotein NlpD
MIGSRLFSIFLTTILLAGCASSVERPPVFELAAAQKSAAQANNSPREKDWRPSSYIVQKGDTLYSIAFNYGFDYHDLAEMNGIKDPSVISIGQVIRLFPNRSGAAAAVAPVLVKPINNLVKDQPRVVEYPYSAAAMAQIDKVQEQSAPAATVVAKAPQAESASNDSNDVVDVPVPGWSLPATGKLIGQFSESDNRKGIDIAGKLGQPVMASAAGKVVYSGSGLRGYGKLIIIKHNNTYLSAYAHNEKILVKEGQNVSRGQKIALMGNTDASQVELHFEVRRFGKPVDPAKYLPLGKL